MQREEDDDWQVHGEGRAGSSAEPESDKYDFQNEVASTLAALTVHYSLCAKVCVWPAELTVCNTVCGVHSLMCAIPYVASTLTQLTQHTRPFLQFWGTDEDHAGAPHAPVHRVFIACSLCHLCLDGVVFWLIFWPCLSLLQQLVLKFCRSRI